MNRRNKKSSDRKKPKSYYTLIEIRELVATGNVLIRDNALDGAQNDFGWGTQDVLDAITKLQPKHFYKSKKVESKATDCD